jgi:hypothetical protein
MKSTAGSSNTLKIDLLNSLQKMHNHTSLVKEGILGMQDLMNQGNSKLKVFVSNISAEKMKICIWGLIKKEFRRGWSSW